jgi:hypothetical protein
MPFHLVVESGNRTTLTNVFGALLEEQIPEDSFSCSRARSPPGCIALQRTLAVLNLPLEVLVSFNMTRSLQENESRVRTSPTWWEHFASDACHIMLFSMSKHELGRV